MITRTSNPNVLHVRLCSVMVAPDTKADILCYLEAMPSGTLLIHYQRHEYWRRDTPGSPWTRAGNFDFTPLDGKAIGVIRTLLMAEIWGAFLANAELHSLKDHPQKYDELRRLTIGGEVAR